MIEIAATQFVRELSAAHPPCATVPQGETVRFYTLDCYSNQLTRTGKPQAGSPRQGSGYNPATGPVYVEGALPGDTLKVEILSIQMPEHGMMRLLPGLGAMAGRVSFEEARRIPIQGKTAYLADAAIPLTPMVGVIGVAPAHGAVDTDTPGDHGGNMDCRLIGEGTALYLPVRQPGALFALGDLHAQMGDGEVAICGLEIAGAVDVRFSVLRGRQEPWPVLGFGKGGYSVLCSAHSLEEAARLARYSMLDFLLKRTGKGAHDLILLMSLVCDLEVCQIVDPLVTMRMTLREGILNLLF